MSEGCKSALTCTNYDGDSIRCNEFNITDCSRYEKMNIKPFTFGCMYFERKR